MGIEKQKLNTDQKTMLLELLNSEKPISSNLLLHQKTIKQRSRKGVIAKTLKKNQLVKVIPLGINSAVVYPTREGMIIAKRIKREEKI